MREEGTVVSVEGGRVRVRVERRPRCAECGICASFPGGGGMSLLAAAPPSAAVGSRVVLEVPESSPMRAALFLCFIPILSFMAGLWLAESLLPAGAGGPAVWMLAGLGCMAASFLALFIRERRAGGRRPRVVEVKPPEGAGS